MAGSERSRRCPDAVREAITIRFLADKGVDHKGVDRDQTRPSRTLNLPAICRVASHLSGLEFGVNEEGQTGGSKFAARIEAPKNLGAGLGAGEAHIADSQLHEGFAMAWNLDIFPGNTGQAIKFFLESGEYAQLRKMRQKANVVY